MDKRHFLQRRAMMAARCSLNVARPARVALPASSRRRADGVRSRARRVPRAAEADAKAAEANVAVEDEDDSAVRCAGIVARVDGAALHHVEQLRKRPFQFVRLHVHVLSAHKLQPELGHESSSLQSHVWTHVGASSGTNYSNSRVDYVVLLCLRLTSL